MQPPLAVGAFGPSHVPVVASEGRRCNDCAAFASPDDVLKKKFRTADSMPLESLERRAEKARFSAAERASNGIRAGANDAWADRFRLIP
jgi:hypothetical protein